MQKHHRRSSTTISMTMTKHQRDKNDSLFKTIAVIGGPKTGKTSLISRFLGKPFEEEHVATIEDYHIAKFYVGEALCHVEIIDTSGTFEFPAMERLTMEKANGFVFVYSLDDEGSFERVTCALKRLKVLKDISELPIVIVCNKGDLANIVEMRNMQVRLDNNEPCLVGECLAKERCFGPREEILCEQIQMARDHGCKFLLTSAKNRWNVNKIFEQLFQERRSEKNALSKSSYKSKKREKGRVKSLKSLMR